VNLLNFIKDDIVAIQYKLNNLGFRCGKNDGYLGNKTKKSLEDFFKKTYFNINQINNYKINQDNFINFFKISGFDYDEKENLYYSSNLNGQFTGYSDIYDELSIFSSIITDREPIYFNYQNTKWVFGIWKGQYGLSTGLILGLYINYKNKYIDNFYKFSEYNENIMIDFKLYKNNKLIIDKSTKNNYFSGFIPGLHSDPSILKVELYLTFKNELFFKSFLESLKKLGYKKYIVKNNTLNFTIERPFTKKVHSRNVTLEKLVQKENNSCCKKFIRRKKSLKLDSANPKNIELIFLKSPKLKQKFYSFYENEKYNLKKLSTFIKNY
jgi:hypothetical protein